MSSLFEKYLRTLHFWLSVLSVVLYRLLQKNPQTEWSGDAVEHCPQQANLMC